MEYKLNIYGGCGIEKTYSTDHGVLPFGVMVDLMELQDEIAAGTESGTKILDYYGPILKATFPGLTDEELQRADFNEVLKVVNDLIAGTNKEVSSLPKSANPPKGRRSPRS